MSDAGLPPYIYYTFLLSLQDGCFLWGSRVIISSRLRPRLLKELHMGHCGSSCMKEFSHSYVWWSNLDSDIGDLSNY